MRIPVPDRGNEARAAALRTALDMSVLRLAGEQALLDFWAQPERLMSSYQYRRSFDGQQDVLELQVRFDERALRQALRDAGFAVWDGPRPPVLTWVDAGSGWLDVTTAAQQLPELVVGSQKWGYSLRFPQLDMAERNRVSVADIRFGKVDEWMAANAAYGPLWSVGLQLVPAPAPAGETTASVPSDDTAVAESYWRSMWTLVDDRQVVAQFELPAMTLAESVDLAWRRMTGMVLAAEVFRRNTAPTQAWTLVLDGITDSEQYLLAMQNLQGAKVPLSVIGLSPAQVSMRVEWRGDAGSLRRQAALWGWTEFQPPQPTPTVSPVQLPEEASTEEDRPDAQTLAQPTPQPTNAVSDEVAGANTASDEMPQAQTAENAGLTGFAPRPQTRFYFRLPPA